MLHTYVHTVCLYGISRILGKKLGRGKIKLTHELSINLKGRGQDWCKGGWVSAPLRLPPRYTNDMQKHACTYTCMYMYTHIQLLRAIGRPCVPFTLSYANKHHLSLSLSLQFLVKNPYRRLGCQPGIGERQIKSHAFFNHVNWEMLEKREIPAPFRPQVVSLPCSLAG